MDNQKFGAFIAAARKEKGMTQSELAEKLHVTDKAVSKWERGAGFPDIKTIEPLATALGLTIFEIMRGERGTEESFIPDNTTEALSAYQRELSRRNTLTITVCITAVILLIFLLDSMQLLLFLGVCLPFILLAVGIFLLITAFRKYKQKQGFFPTLFWGIFALLYPILIFLLLLFSFALGGPVPN